MQYQSTQRSTLIFVTPVPPARRVVSRGGSTILYVPAPRGPRGYLARHRKPPEGVMSRAMARAERIFRRLTYAVKHPGWARRRSWDCLRSRVRSTAAALWARRRELHLLAWRGTVRYIRAQWRALPGPWPVKAVLIALAVAEPGPFGEIALAAYTNAVAAHRAAQGRAAAAAGVTP